MGRRGRPTQLWREVMFDVRDQVRAILVESRDELGGNRFDVQHQLLGCYPTIRLRERLRNGSDVSKSS